MTHAYDEIYLSKAQKAMGDMCHFVVHDWKWDLQEYFLLFISTGVARLVEIGSPDFVVGKSGYEIAYEVYYRQYGEECSIRPNYVYGKSPEYFAGWSVAYFSWYRNLSYEKICNAVSMNKIVDLYHPYHEMDVMQFVAEMERRMTAQNFLI